MSWRKLTSFFVAACITMPKAPPGVNGSIDRGRRRGMKILALSILAAAFAGIWAAVTVLLWVSGGFALYWAMLAAAVFIYLILVYAANA